MVKQNKERQEILKHISVTGDVPCTIYTNGARRLRMMLLQPGPVRDRLQVSAKLPSPVNSIVRVELAPWAWHGCWTPMLTDRRENKAIIGPVSPQTAQNRSSGGTRMVL